MVIPGREGKCCDAVLKQIERAAGTGRTAVSDPELTGEGPPIDLRATVGSQAYALEHTRILPFDGRIEAAMPYRDIRDHLVEWFPDPLPGNAFYQLRLPLGVRRPGRGLRGERRLRGLREWIRSAVDELHARAPGRRRWPPHVYVLDFVSGRPDGWEMEFTLARSSDGVVPPQKAGSLYVALEPPEEPEPAFVESLRRAFEHKCPKLAQCKDLKPDIQTVLVLEAVDAPLECDLYIGEHLDELLQGCAVAPDLIFLVRPDALFWQVWVVKSNDVQWPDERLPMHHKWYQDSPKLVHEEAYPRQFVEQFKQTMPPETPAKWRPFFRYEDDLEDAKKAVASQRVSSEVRT